MMMMMMERHKKTFSRAKARNFLLGHCSHCDYLQAVKCLERLPATEAFHNDDDDDRGGHRSSLT
jgi:hypothetical protein